MPLFVPLAVILAEAAPAPSPLQTFLPIVLMVAVVYFIVLRPMSKQEKDRKKRVDGLKKGDEVVIGGGIVGRLSNTDDAMVWTVEIADRVKVRVLRKDVVDSFEAATKAAQPAGGAKKAPEAEGPGKG